MESADRRCSSSHLERRAASKKFAYKSEDSLVSFHQLLARVGVAHDLELAQVREELECLKQGQVPNAVPRQETDQELQNLARMDQASPKSDGVPDSLPYTFDQMYDSERTVGPAWEGGLAVAANARLGLPVPPAIRPAVIAPPPPPDVRIHPSPGRMQSRLLKRSNSSLSGGPCSNGVPCNSNTVPEVEMLEFWNEAASEKHRSTSCIIGNQLGKDKSFGAHTTKFSRQQSGSSVQSAARPCLRSFIIMPTAIYKIIWDWLTMALIVFDVVMLPLQAFEVEQTVEVGIVIACFWVVDFIFHFMTAFNDGMYIETRHRVIFQRYLKSWLVPDLLILISEWCVLLALNSAGTSRMVAAFRAGRGVRILRAFRTIPAMMRLQKLKFRIHDLVDFAAWTVGFKIAELGLFAILLLHFMACSYFWIGTHSLANGLDSWVMPYHELWSDALEAKGMMSLYVEAFHWSLAQFTPAPCSRHPVSTYEWTYALFVLIVFIVVFPPLIAELGTFFTSIRRLHADRITTMHAIHRFTEQHCISSACRARVIKWVKKVQSMKQRAYILEADVAAIRSLPDSLLKLLHNEMHSPALKCLPLMWYLSEYYTEVALEVAHKAATEMVVESGKDLFSQFQEAKRTVYIVHKGVLRYKIGSGSRSSKIDVEAGQWLCEAVIWVRWFHRGTAYASKAKERVVKNDTEATIVVLLDADKFCNTVALCADALSDCAAYAHSFCSWCQESEQLTDLVPGPEAAESFIYNSFCVARSDSTGMAIHPIPSEKAYHISVTAPSDDIEESNRLEPTLS
eukprot:TRINITY_DN9821_c0_g1_i3.p1 TRINITY_DN9821_c0_g1~~TRINITY_DN9821_c0_g1_i3.p1  ORF type:complete len:811 (-),score=64.34 TRINITY_DN9821_c0_g1_i3:287-2665(-)